jgi:hypothetical protein
MVLKEKITKHSAVSKLNFESLVSRSKFKLENFPFSLSIRTIHETIPDISSFMLQQTASLFYAYNLNSTIHNIEGYGW